MDMPMRSLSELEKLLLDTYQHGVPLESRPFARIGDILGIGEQAVLHAYRQLREMGVVSRIGPVFQPNRVGVSTLAALSVPLEKLQQTAEFVSAFAEVNHNYEREHHFNLWFVVTAHDPEHLHAVVEAITRKTGLDLIELPLIEDYFIDLGFDLRWT